MPETAKDLIGYHHPNYRQSGKETLVLQAYVGLNDTQTDKLGKGLVFLSGGLRIPAPRQERIDLKNQYLCHNHTTLRHDNILQEQRVKTGKAKKGTALTRETFVTVSKTDPLGNVVVTMGSLFSEKNCCHLKIVLESIGSVTQGSRILFVGHLNLMLEVVL